MRLCHAAVLSDLGFELEWRRALRPLNSKSHAVAIMDGVCREVGSTELEEVIATTSTSLSADRPL